MYIKIPCNKDTSIQSNNSSSYNFGLCRSNYVFSYSPISGSRAIGRSLFGFDFSTYVSRRNLGILDESKLESSSIVLFTMPSTGSIQVADETLELGYLTSSWDEGSGSCNGALSQSSCWTSASFGVPWSVTGSDYISGTTQTLTTDKFFNDLNFILTSSWITNLVSGTYTGLILKYTNSEENSTNNYWKTLYTRHTFGLKSPHILMSFYDVVKDDRKGIKVNQSSSLYLYNYDQDGVLVNNSSSFISCSLYANIPSGSSGSIFLVDVPVGNVGVGLYTASFVLTSSYSGSIYDYWKDSNGVVAAFSSASVYDYSRSFTVHNNLQHKTMMVYPNIRLEYEYNEVSQIRVYFYRTRQFERTGSLQEQVIPQNVYYAIDDSQVGWNLIDFSRYTQLSYDKESNYFNFCFDLLEANRDYFLRFKVVEDNKTTEFSNVYRFRIKKLDGIFNNA